MLKVGYRSVRLHQGVRSQLLTHWFAYASCCQDVCCNLCAILEINRAYKLSAPDFMTICLYEITVNSNVVEFLCKKSGAPNNCFLLLLLLLLLRIFCFFRTATNAQMIIPLTYNFRTLSTISLSIILGLIFHISLSRLVYFPQEKRNLKTLGVKKYDGERNQKKFSCS